MKCEESLVEIVVRRSDDVLPIAVHYSQHEVAVCIPLESLLYSVFFLSQNEKC